MNNHSISRRDALAVGGAAVVLGAAGTLRAAASSDAAAPLSPGSAAQPARSIAPSDPLELRFAVKFGMVNVDTPLAEKFALLKALGYDGIELDSPTSLRAEEVRAASAQTGLPVHGVVDGVHWNTRLSDPDPAVREKGRAALEHAIRDSKTFGGSSVLLVPGVAGNAETENHDHVRERSIEQIHRVLPLAAELGVHILIENVWNRFCYDHDGGDDQSADQLARYIDAISSPWVGVYFDIGNHRKYGRPEEWIRTLGRRIVKCDVKDWGKAAGWSKIGEGDVDWAAVRTALRDIAFTGWCTAEVAGGGEAVLREIKERMDRCLRA